MSKLLLRRRKTIIIALHGHNKTIDLRTIATDCSLSTDSNYLDIELQHALPHFSGFITESGVPVSLKHVNHDSERSIVRL